MPREASAAGGFDPVEAEEGEETAEEFEPGAALAEEDDAESGGGDGKEIREAGELGSFEIAEEPEVKDIRESRAEEGGVDQAEPTLPRDVAEISGKAKGVSLLDRDGKDEERTEDEIPEGHGEGVVLASDAFAEDDIGGKADGTAHGDGIAEKRGGMMAHAGAGGEDGDAGEGDGHAGGFAPGELFETKENGEGERVDGREADDDGGVGDAGVAEAEGETELIDADAEEAEVGEDPVIMKKWPFGLAQAKRVTSGEWRDNRRCFCGGMGQGGRAFAEDGEAGAERGDEDHEEARGNNAEGSEGERGEIADTDFDDEKIEGPDGNDEGDRESDGSA